jgi:two-component system response regulator AtoC
VEDRGPASRIRFLSTTNRDLHDEMARGAFRPDLYHRLGGAVLTVPPLRDRRCEIEPLAERFLGSAAPELALASPPRLTAEAVDLLLTYPWPGNVRELRNVMERVVLVSRGEQAITPEHLLAASGLAPGRPAAGREATRLRLVRETPDDEQTRIAQALRACAGNQTGAARALGISRATLIRRLRTFGLPRPRSSKP